jgi:hypothetical protein
MTTTEYLIWFVAMAVAIMAIIVVGTLAAADIIHPGRRTSKAPTGQQGKRADEERR